MSSSRRAAHIAALALVLCLVASRGRASPPPQDALAAPPTLQQIAVLLERGDFSGASRLVEPALKAHPADPVLHNLAGVIAAQQGAFESAEAHFRDGDSPRPEESCGVREPRASLPGARRRQSGHARQSHCRLPSTADGRTRQRRRTVPERLAAGARRTVCRQPRDARAKLPEDVRQRPQALAVLAADLAGTRRHGRRARAVDALAAHPALTEADVLAVLPALPGRFGRRRRRARCSRRWTGAGWRRLARFRRWRRFTAREAAGLPTRARCSRRAVAAEGASAPLLMDLARTAVKLKDYQGALGYLAHARSLEPGNATVHFLFGMVCVEENLGREAYESMKKAVELDPDNPLVNYAMGAVATHRHEPSESLPYFEKYVRLKPDDPRGHFALGAALFYSNQFDEARPELERATRAPETATGGHYFLARIARQSNDLAYGAPRDRACPAAQRRPCRRVGGAGVDSDPLEGVRARGTVARRRRSRSTRITTQRRSTWRRCTPGRKIRGGRHRRPRSRHSSRSARQRAQQFLRIIEAVPYVR